MFRRSRELSFSRYEQRRRPWGLPRWLWLLLAGAALGAAAVLYVQQALLPPRLTPAASRQLTQTYASAEAERLRLAQAQLQLKAQLAAATEAQQRQAAELAASRASVEGLRRELAVLVDAFPPDPRPGVVAVRAMRFVDAGNTLAYDLALSRDGAQGQPLAAVMQMVVTGQGAAPGETALTLPPVPVSLGAQAVLRGTHTLPAGFRPRQAAVHILGGPGGRLLGMRVGLVR